MPAGLQFLISKEKVKFHRLNISGFSRNVSHNVVERFLEQNVGKRAKLIRAEEADWLVFWGIQDEMLKNMVFNGKTVYVGEQPATLVITQRGLTFDETKRVVIKELEANETREQMEVRREIQEPPRQREPRTPVRQISRAQETPRSEVGTSPENWRPSNPCTKDDEERCKHEGRCFRCGSKEHMFAECPEKKSWKGKGRGRRDSRETPPPTWKRSTSPYPKGERGGGGAPADGTPTSRGGTQMYLNQKSGGAGPPSSPNLRVQGDPHRKENEGAQGLSRLSPWENVPQTDSPRVCVGSATHRPDGCV